MAASALFFLLAASSHNFALASDEDQAAPAEKKTFVVTAYYKPLPGQSRYLCGNYKSEKRMNGEGLKTSSGTAPHEGTVAADPRVLPYGTKVNIPGYGEGKVEDTGGAIKGNRIDVFMGEGESALEKSVAWGKKKVEIEITPV
ncbi:MAG: 3D domain-containing protein [Parcubacteria group bacterium]|jgi:3D (Asp-Asp-Asp) domain-containing protein